jgi:alpha-L-fucosidase
MRTWLLSVVACLFATCGQAADPLASKEFIQSLPMTPGPYQPTWQSMASQYKVPEWFRDAKLGIFMHWGICSVPARHGWYGLAMCDPEGCPDVVDFHRKTYGHPSVFGYKDLIPLWKAEKWDPDVLVRRYRAAGARYIMPVAVHHDNFDNYDSAHQPWNSVNMGPKRDILGEWRKAALAQGLHFTASTHQHEAWDWFHRSYNYDKIGSLAGVPWDAWQTRADGKGKWWDGYAPADLYVNHFLPWDSLDVIHRKMVRTNRGDWPNERDILDDQAKVIGAVKADPDAQAKFVRNWYLRTKDLIDKYHPEILHFDWGLPFSPWACRDAVYLRLQTHYYNASLKWNDGRMLVGANLKHIKDWPVEWQTGSHDEIRRSCIEDFEGGRAGDVPAPEPWQQCNLVNNEWFDDSLSPHHVTKRPEDIIRILVDTVARNGNLLLNIALRADGTAVKEDSAVLDALTEFMAVNSEAIHGTRPWVVAMDRPSETYFTTKPGTLYAICLRWPDDGKLTIRALAEDHSPWIGSVKEVSLLGTAERVQWTRTPQGGVFQIPGRKPENLRGLVLNRQGDANPVVAAARAPVEIKPPAEQDQMEAVVRKFLGDTLGKPPEGNPNDLLRRKVGDVLRDGACSFSGFLAIVEGTGRNANGTPLIQMRSFVHAEASYELRVSEAELQQSKPPLRAGDKVLFDGRFEGSTIRSSTKDFPVIHGYVTRIRRQP